jgi:hypothetical protein
MGFRAMGQCVQEASTAAEIFETSSPDLFIGYTLHVDQNYIQLYRIGAGSTVGVPSTYDSYYQALTVCDELTSVSPLEVGTAFSWGFGVVVFFWFIGYSIRAAKQPIKQV